ncbi:MAG: NAD(P)H-dependent oxidoreductase [Candidatus Theseobacter exili]|nr:NAD(P)H-dependent oxidoreductase [Candidatus Theseobacter exili]
MNILIIVAHPDKKSFNHAIANTVAETLHNNGHETVYIDLHECKFNAVLPNHEIYSDAQVSVEIEKYCEQLVEAEGIIVVHPNWWGQPPAILKGWVDRIFRPGVAYKFTGGDMGEGIPVGLLNAETAIVFNTSNTATEREISVFCDPLETLWKNCIFNLCGVDKFYRKMFNIVIASTVEERTEWLKEVKETIDKYYPAT